MKPVRPLDKYMSNTPNGSYNKIEMDMRIIDCWDKKLYSINKIINDNKEIRNKLIDELIILIRGNSAKHKQFIKEMEIKTIETYLSDCFIIKKKIILKNLHIITNK